MAKSKKSLFTPNPLVAAIVVVIGIGLVFGLVLGLRFLLPDNHSSSFKNGQQFSYAGYNFKLVGSLQSVKPDTNDCSGLLPGGIFGPDAKKVTDSNQNWWPKEDCEKQNQDRVAAAEKRRNLNIQYSIVSKSSSVKKINDGWLKAITSTGKEIKISVGDLSFPPHGKVSNIIEVQVDQAAAPFTLIVQVNPHSPQNVTMTN